LNGARRSVTWSALALALLAIVLVVSPPRLARAFGDLGAFDPRVLLTGAQTAAARPDAPRSWSLELESRTSAPVRHRPLHVRADEGALVDESFVYWSGDSAVQPLTGNEIAGLRRFLSLGGVMLVDDAAPAADGSPGPFGRTARVEVARVIPDAAPIAIGTEHVIFRSFYLLPRAVGRVLGPRTLDAVIRGGKAQVVFSEHDLGGALARSVTGAWAHQVAPGGEAQREQAVRLAVNIAMYVLCSNYKDDQVHAQSLMRRGAFSPEWKTEP
jgi:hypothetical protein